MVVIPRYIGSIHGVIEIYRKMMMVLIDVSCLLAFKMILPLLRMIQIIVDMVIMWLAKTVTVILLTHQLLISLLQDYFFLNQVIHYHMMMRFFCKCCWLTLTVMIIIFGFNLTLFSAEGISLFLLRILVFESIFFFLSLLFAVAKWI